MQPANLATFPSVLIVLGSNSNGAPAAVFRMAPQHLFINMAWDHGAYCLSVMDNGSACPFPLTQCSPLSLMALQMAVEASSARRP
jgi:hypothetical protein